MGPQAKLCKTFRLCGDVGFRGSVLLAEKRGFGNIYSSFSQGSTAGPIAGSTWLSMLGVPMRALGCRVQVGFNIRRNIFLEGLRGSDCLELRFSGSKGVSLRCIL